MTEAMTRTRKPSVPRRVLRWLTWFTVSLCILLLGPTLIFWMRSYDSADFWQTRTQESNSRLERSVTLTLASAGGRIGVLNVSRENRHDFSTRRWIMPAYAHQPWKWESGDPTKVRHMADTDSFWNKLGFGLKVSATSTTRLVSWMVPYWAITLVLVTWPTVFFAWLARRAERRKQGMCDVCGYDLRASTERCPECGTAIKPKTTAEPEPLTRSRRT